MCARRGGFRVEGLVFQKEVGFGVNSNIYTSKIRIVLGVDPRIKGL